MNSQSNGNTAHVMYCFKYGVIEIYLHLSLWWATQYRHASAALIYDITGCYLNKSCLIANKPKNSASLISVLWSDHGILLARGPA